MTVKEKTDDLILHVLSSMLEKKGYNDIKANIEDYPSPAKITKMGTEDFYIPDITAVKNGSKSYFEIAIKTTETTDLMSKWVLLDQLATMKGGKLHIIAPRGHYRFADEIINKGNLDVTLIKL